MIITVKATQNLLNAISDILVFSNRKAYYSLTLHIQLYELNLTLSFFLFMLLAKEVCGIKTVVLGRSTVSFFLNNNFCII